MLLEMKVPSPGESITEVEIANWLVQTGDYVEKDQPIAEVDSDKATLELPAQESGIITLKAKEGDVVQVGQVVCLINTDATKEQTSTTDTTQKEDKIAPAPTENEVIIKETSPISNDKVVEVTYATGVPSPAAKKIIEEKNIDPTTIHGSGKDGRIIKEDVIEYKAAMGTAPQGSVRETDVTKLSLLRRKIAERLVSVKNETAMLTTFNEVDMSGIYKIRDQYKDQFKEKHGVSLGFMSFFTLACVQGLQKYPDVNAMIDGDYKINYKYVDMGIAVSGPKGLMVPVLRNAENMTFRQVEEGIKNLAIRARDGELTVDEMTGGTFTITNGGVFGSMLSTPILNPPQSAILGMHNIVDRPVAIDGKVEIRPIMYLAVSYDHRIIDGKEAVGFLVTVKEAIENPVELLMGGESNITKSLELA